MLLEIYPLPDGVVPAAASSLPPSRVTMKLEDGTNSSIADPLLSDEQYHTAKLLCNRRITSPDWYQDVRQIELSFHDEIEYDPSLYSNFSGLIWISYNPGDVAVIHPEILSKDVDSFLSTMGWSDIAGSLCTIGISLQGAPRPFSVRTPVHGHLDQTLPDHLPASTTLRTIFTRHLNINAVPRYGFFEILHHFAENSLEKEKLQEFITPEGAVRSVSFLEST